MLGKIFYFGYSGKNFTDPTPLLFVLARDRDYTEGINLNHIDNGLKRRFMTIAVKFNGVFKDMKPEGRILYTLLEKELGVMIQLGYRKYLNSHINGGLLVSQCLTYNDSNRSSVREFNNSFIVSLNKELERERVNQFQFNRNKKHIDQIKGLIEKDLNKVPGNLW